MIPARGLDIMPFKLVGVYVVCAPLRFLYNTPFYNTATLERAQAIATSNSPYTELADQLAIS